MRCIIPGVLFFVILSSGLEADQPIPFYQLQIRDLEANSAESNGTLDLAEEPLFSYPELFLKGREQQEGRRTAGNNKKMPFSDRMWLEATVAAMNGDIFDEDEKSNRNATLSPMLPVEELSVAEYYLVLKLQESAAEKEAKTSEEDSERALLQEDTFLEELEKSFGITEWDMSSYATGKSTSEPNRSAISANPYLPSSGAQENPYTEARRDDFVSFTFREETSPIGSVLNDFPEYKKLTGQNTWVSSFPDKSMPSQTTPLAPKIREEEADTHLRKDSLSPRQSPSHGSQPDYFKGFDQF